MATLTIREPDKDGGLTLSAAAGAGDEFANDGRTLLVVRNGGGSSVTVSVTAQVTSADDSTYGKVAISDGGGAIAAGGVDVFGPFSTRAFNDSNQRAQVTYSGVTSVEVAAVRLPR